MRFWSGNVPTLEVTRVCHLAMGAICLPHLAAISCLTMQNTHKGDRNIPKNFITTY